MKWSTFSYGKLGQFDQLDISFGRAQGLLSVLFTARSLGTALHGTLRHSVKVCWINSIRAELDECWIENLLTLANVWFCDLSQDNLTSLGLGFLVCKIKEFILSAKYFSTLKLCALEFISYFSHISIILGPMLHIVIFSWFSYFSLHILTSFSLYLLF